MAYQYITKQAEVDRLLPTLMSQPSWGLDTETTGLNPIDDKVILLQIGNEKVQYMFDTRVVNLDPLKPFFESREIKKVGFNLKFDYKMIKSSLGIEVENLRCLYLGERLLWNGLVSSKTRGFFSLDQTMKRRLEIELDKSMQKSFIGHQGAFTEDQLLYAAKDVEYMLALARVMSAAATKDSLDNTWRLESEVIPAFGDMELSGTRLLQDQWKRVLAEHKERLLAAKSALDQYCSPFFQTNLFGEVEGIDYDSPKQVIHLLKQMGVKVTERDAQGNEVEKLIEKTDKATQKKLRGLKIIQLLEDYRKWQKRVTTYGENYIQAIHPKTGRIHFEVDQMGTETGRPANRGAVNMLNIPRDNRFRNAFIASEGHVIETDDFSGCELRILAELSLEPRFVEAFQKGEDVHCTVASDLYGVTVTKKNENAKLRTPAKSLNFGLAYGMGPGKLCDTLNGDGFPITFDQARELFNKYVNTYKNAIGFLRGAGEQAEVQGFIANINGRRRYWNKPDPEDDKYKLGERDPDYKKAIAAIQREGGNFVIQSVNADITKLAMVEIRKYKKKHGIRTEFQNQIYDEIVTDTHADDSQEFHKIKQKIMVDAAANWLKTVPMGVDGHVGPAWHKD